MGNTTPNESRYDWDLSSGIFPHLIEHVIMSHQHEVNLKVSEVGGFIDEVVRNSFDHIR
jgi:hypothetical protein